MPDFNEELMPAMQDAITRISDRVYGPDMTEEKLGFMNLLWETAKQESLGGQLDPENINRITRILIRDYDRLEGLATEYGPEGFDASEFNIQVDAEGNPDLSDPYTNFAMTAVSYIAKSKGLLGGELRTPESRASAWKEYHNTIAGAGTEEEYLDKARRGVQILWGQGQPRAIGQRTAIPRESFQPMRPYGMLGR